ncbi:MAG: beta-propeller domain-containing protein [Thermoleophilaceae bacterium]|nr:beta-propeller domain-containing protein [Thermoleophilaceae bacterium]
MLKGAIAAGLVLALVAAPAAGAASPKRPKLEAFSSCKQLVSYAKKHVPRSRTRPKLVGETLPAPTPQQDGTRAPATGGGETPDFSPTNNQEAGVDEPDVVKTDGRRIFAAVDGTLHVFDATTNARSGSVKLGGSDHELFLAGNRVLAVGAPGGVRPSTVVGAPVGEEETTISEVDVTGAPKVVRTQEVDGNYVSARMSGTTARVVIHSQPRAEYELPRLRSRTTGWLPSSKTGAPKVRKGAGGKAVPCNEVRRATVFSGLDVLTVLSIDMSKGLPAVDSDAVMTNAQTTYASQTGLFLTTERGEDQTAIHRFDVSKAGESAYTGSGSVTGTVLNQFSLSERDGFLRVATTGTDGDASESAVTVLDSSLNRVGRVGGLGKGERIYSVRFIGDRGYVVTFRQTDPLYTLDLSNNAAPRVTGELKIRGFSSYLHPISDTQLIGVGQDATDQGQTLGTQLSLFDVSNPAAPARIAQRTLGSDVSSQAEYDHKAFLWWAPARLAVIPVARNGSSGAIGFGVDAGGINETGRLAHTQAEVTRTFVVGDRLFSLSSAGLGASTVPDLAPVAFTAIP